MTKTVRIENADGGLQHKVRVTVQMQVNGEWVDAQTKAMVSDLTHPTMMLTETIWKGKRLIVEEFE